MEAYQLRVVEEKKELDEKIERLKAFMEGSIFASLDRDERSRLTLQLEHMNGYSEVLGQRIAAFK